MWSKKTKIILIVIAVLILSFFGYRRYVYDDFKRAYESGAPTYEQFYALTGYGDELFGKQYVKAVKEAGYYIDDLNLMMMERIPVLTSKKHNIEIVPNQRSISVRFNYLLNGRYISVFQLLNRNMRRERSGVYDLLDENGDIIKSIELSEAEEQELTDIAVSEIEDLLSDVYHSMYPKEK